VLGEGNPIDLVWAPAWVSHLVLDWEWRPLVEWRRGLARFCRLIVFDKRGTGLSDRQAGVATLEERSDDIRAVMDAAGSEQAVLFGVSEGGSMACFFAATYPARTRALILWEVQARWVQSADYPWGATPEKAEQAIRELAEQGPTDEYLFGSTPEARERFEAGYYEFFKRYAQGAASPAAYADLERMNAEIDVRRILPSIRVPTLVMNRVADRVANTEASRQLAAAIKGARYLEFPGEIHGTFALDAPVLEAVEEFVTGDSPRREPERALATIMFTDIVGATAKATELGDRKWGELRHSTTGSSAASSHAIKATKSTQRATASSPPSTVQRGRSVARPKSAPPSASSAWRSEPDFTPESARSWMGKSAALLFTSAPASPQRRCRARYWSRRRCATSSPAPESSSWIEASAN
jgi:pimeloyl-ACP methyl ester carboxylesterase